MTMKPIKLFCVVVVCLAWGVAHGQTNATASTGVRDAKVIDYKKKDVKEKKQKKRGRHLVWCGYKQGFHWSTPGKDEK